MGKSAVKKLGVEQREMRLRYTVLSTIFIVVLFWLYFYKFAGLLIGYPLTFSTDFNQGPKQLLYRLWYFWILCARGYE